MKFGKQILAQQIPGWNAYYLDYKSLKKIVSSLTSGGPPTEAAALALGAATTRDQTVASIDSPPTSADERTDVNNGDVPSDQTLAFIAATGLDEDRGPDFQAHKTAFFFKLERELEKINSFYLQKEAELKLRLETLLSKRRAAAVRLLPDTVEGTPKDHVEWRAVEEGFRLLERDLAKLQQFVDINATGFRKILKKWDKRSKSTTKELYLARQVEVQPVFNRQLIAELSDIVSSCLLDMTDLSIGTNLAGSAVNDLMLTHQITMSRSSQFGPYRDLEANLLNAVKMKDDAATRELIRQADVLRQQPEGRTLVTRILWKVIIDASPPFADLILSSLVEPFDFNFVDDINGRTCLHEAAIVGELRLLDMCINKGVQLDRVDVYGRNALHYAAINGHPSVCRRLLSLGLQPSVRDMDNYTPLLYAVLKGNLECVRVLLDDGRAGVEAPTTAVHLIPLTIACRVGHIEVVKLLLQHGARSIPDTNGCYPIHFAAQEGHAEICRLLYQYEGWDLQDKYNDWTPLFHAARHGHEDCVRVLLELGSRVGVTDETGKQAVFYAAWYGHPRCVDLLLTSAARTIPSGSTRAHLTPHISPVVQNTTEAADIDLIPSLSLPPPIMPYRVYGHNFLDKACLVHVSVGHPFTSMARKQPAVNLSSRIVGPSDAHLLHTSPLFKLVMNCKPDITAAPYSVFIPVGEEKDFFTFQTANINELSLEFSMYPSFGTKTIGRAVALSSMLRSTDKEVAFVLPILDHHLHVIGEVSFEVRIVTPFRGVTLEIGGAVETYWKSLATPFSTSQKSASRMGHPFRSFASANVSPLAYSISGSAGHTILLSSLTGDYVHVVVQVTRDLNPVVFDGWRLPLTELDVGVSDVTYTQLHAIAVKAGRGVELTHQSATSPSEWHKLLSGSFLTLRQLMKILPPSLGIYLDVAYPPVRVRERVGLSHSYVLEHNAFVDAILRAVYQSSPQQSRRRVVFGSFSPDICAALNWKQPNYPVFMASECGIKSHYPPTQTALSPADTDDRRLSSISASVEWAKANNLLGLFLDADLLTKVPTLIQGARDTGLLIGAYGRREQTHILSRSSNPETQLIDASIQEGIVSFLDHSSRGYS